MLTVWTEEHLLRNAKTELCGGELVPPFECPARVDYILAELRKRGLGEERQPKEFGMETAHKVHADHYLAFMETAFDRWVEAGNKGEAIPTIFPFRRGTHRIPNDIDAALGYYAMAIETSLTASTWDAAKASMNVALEAQQAVADGARVAFALCRPPGHHAAKDMYGGYCFINNAAVAAQAFLDQGKKRVAVLDVDFHHGNGTQDIFYERDDVFFASIHGQPEDAFPNFLGYADETGSGKGSGYNINYPLPAGTPYGPWRDCLSDALIRIKEAGCEALIISLGVDTFKNDPISFFKLESEDFVDMGALLESAGLPSLIVMEGGYAVEEIGINAVNVLEGFEKAVK